MQQLQKARVKRRLMSDFCPKIQFRFLMTAEPYAPLGDSYLPPTDSANSHIALELEKETSTPQFYQLKKKSICSAYFKKNHNYVFLSYRNLV